MIVEDRAHRAMVGQKVVRRTGAARCAWALSLMLVMQAAVAGAQAMSQPGLFKVCDNQHYALCAAATCFVFDQVAYCKCDVEYGNSVSAPYAFDGENVCSVNAQGVDNGYMVSTYSLPASVVAGGNQAIYTCRGGTSNGAYAQCDGGICFDSTRGQSFPGFAQPLQSNEIICSCPITVANLRDFIGYQIVGPYPCQSDFYKNCNSASTNTKTGSTIPVGAPTGVATLLTYVLNGSVPKLNQCPPPR
jgi:hypothetical protein